MLEYKIYQNSQIDPIFIKASSYLITKYKNKILDLSPLAFNELLEKLWNIEFNVKIKKDTVNEWDCLVFETDYDLTIFLLKWKS